MGFFKSSKKTKPEGEAKSKDPVSDLPLNPGYFGQFPARFTVHFGEKSADKKKETFYLCVEGPQGPAPIFAVERFYGMARHTLTLYSGPNPTTPPLAYVGITKTLKGEHQLVLPGTQNTNGANQILLAVHMLKDSFVLDNVEYRWMKDPSVSALSRQPILRPVETRLVRLDPYGNSEMLGSYVATPNAEQNGVLGEFSFQGPAAVGQMSPSFLLAEVVSVTLLTTNKWLVKDRNGPCC